MSAALLHLDKEYITQLLNDAKGHPLKDSIVQNHFNLDRHGSIQRTWH